ncbi:MAG: protein-glutamate O-methyltransferase CheR, partial [Candidatus Eremiobacteraeota bacterium]|nr:protein-glutamate O-methyltransferase CheR [Candidatus Eremiobacteraeota bacterium]
MSAVAISETEFRVLRDLIRKRIGIFYDDTKQFLLQSRLQTRLVKCSLPDFSAYHRYLTIGTEREREWSELASVLSNNETYFFRERAQLDVLASVVLEDALRRSGNLRVWSAACSTGEEPFTLAMMLLGTQRIGANQLKIRASDISPRALERCSE